MSGTIFNTCVATLGEDVSDRDLLECVAVGFSEENSSATNYARTVLLVLCAALIFFMQAGFAM